MPAPVIRGWRLLGDAANQAMPKSLLGRSLMIVVAPMLILCRC